MMHRSPILSVLLAILLAWSPWACLCGPKAVEAATSCCTSDPAPTKSGCCGSDGDADTQRVSDCSGGSETSGAPNGGCDRCEGNCKCKTAPTMKAESQTTAHITVPVSVAMVFGFEPPQADRAILIRVVRIASKAVSRPLMTLLRQHCALTI